MNAHAPLPVVGHGLYPLPVAARLAQLDARTAGRWAKGYAFSYHGETRSSRGIISMTLPPIGRHADLTFPEMLTLRLVKGFKDAGLSLRTIKQVAEVAAGKFGSPTPFITQSFRTDGRKVFVELQAIAPSNDTPAVTRRERELIEVLTGQRQFAEIVEPSLFAKVDWSDEMAARWWPLGRDHAVVLDPQFLFGAPRIANTRLPTEVLASAVSAEGGGDAAMKSVADWYGVDATQVRDAVEFEAEWSQQAA
jgi:uncharacterized protein (DUF433 family)